MNIIAAPSDPEPDPPGQIEDRGRVVQKLVAILSDGIDIHRCLAARALGRIGAPAAVEALTGALLDEDEDVRIDAAAALSELADHGACDQLLQNLIGDPVSDVKRAAIRALATARHGEAIPWLRRLLAGADPAFAWDEEEYYDQEWDSWVDLQAESIAALAKMDAREAVVDIVAAIADEDGQDLTENAFKALAGLGEPGAAALAAYCQDTDDRRRRRAVSVLVGIGGVLSDEAATRALGDPSADVRRAAARSLAARDPGDRRLAGLFDDPDPVLRAEAFALLDQRQCPSPERFFADQSRQVRIAALEAVAGPAEEAGDTAIIDGVRDALAGKDAGVAAAAAVAYARLTPEEAGADLANLLADPAQAADLRLGALKGLRLIGGPEAVAALGAAVADDNRQLRLETLAALGDLAKKSPWPNAAGQLLLAALDGELCPENEPAAPVATAQKPEPQGGDPARDSAPAEDAFPTSTLQSITSGDGTSAPSLSAPDDDVVLTEEDLEFLRLTRNAPKARRVQAMPYVPLRDDVPRLAARILGDIAESEVVAALVRHLPGADRELCLTAADSLARIGEISGSLPAAVIRRLRELSESPDPEKRAIAVRALGASRDTTAAEIIGARLTDDDAFTRAEAVRALSRLDQAGDKIEHLLGDPDPGVRLAAAEAVAAAGEVGCVVKLAGFAGAFEGYHRREAACLLRRLNARAANDVFLQMLADGKQMRLWSVAIEALEEINCLEETAP